VTEFIGNLFLLPVVIGGTANLNAGEELPGGNGLCPIQILFEEARLEKTSGLVKTIILAFRCPKEGRFGG
jgi:hypothetical protein